MADKTENKYNIGDIVFVPHAYEWTWNPYMTTIKDIIKENDGSYRYYADCLFNSLFNNEPSKMKEFPFREHEIFLSLEDCRSYIQNYYYGGLCRNCKYDKISGTIWSCSDCEHKLMFKNDTPGRFEKYVCELTGITVGAVYQAPHECCKFYKPTRKQNIEEYVSWEHYDDILLNCEFNKACEHHKKSAHKTCSYERYMNELVSYPKSFEFNGRTVKYAKIPRRMWIDLNFISGDIIKCKCLTLEPVLTESGRIKKGTANNAISFNGIAEINTKTGEIVKGNYENANE